MRVYAALTARAAGTGGGRRGTGTCCLGKSAPTERRAECTLTAHNSTVSARFTRVPYMKGEMKAQGRFRDWPLGFISLEASLEARKVTVSEALLP